jgi:hypothetical protein
MQHTPPNSTKHIEQTQSHHSIKTLFFLNNNNYSKKNIVCSVHEAKLQKFSQKAKREWKMRELNFINITNNIENSNRHSLFSEWKTPTLSKEWKFFYLLRITRTVKFMGKYSCF